ncbi:MAG: hypothetical protein ACYC7D_08040 [Nitrososphaerales archaeon]
MPRKFSAFLTIGALAFFLLTSLILGGALPTHATSVNASNHDGYWLKSSMNFNTYGQFQVNETLNEMANSTIGVSSVTFGVPSAYSGHLADESAYIVSQSTRYNASITQSIRNNSLLLTVSFQPGLPAGSNGTVNLGFYVLNTFVATNGSNYNVPMLFYPSVNLPLNELVSQIVLPYLTTHVSNGSALRSAGFSQTINSSSELWANTFTNSTYLLPSYGVVNVYSNPDYSGSIDFTFFSRQLTIDSSGSVIVQDSITAKNLGENTVILLSYTPLTNSSTLTLIPSSETLLSNVQSTTLSAGQIALTSINSQIEPGSSETVILQYPLSSQYWTYTNGIYFVNIPPTPPVRAVIDQYQLTTKSSSGIIFTNGTGASSIALNNTTALSDQVLFNYRLGIGSAFGAAIPLASLLFIAVFAVALVFRPRTATEDDASTTFDALIKSVEDKISGTNEILSEMKSKGASVSRGDLVTARSRIDELRAKSANRIGVLRSQITSPSVSIQAGLNHVSSTDREFDKDVRDELNSYDQFISKRMKEETFLRLIQTYERRLQQMTNAYLDSVHDLREEYESES